MIQKQDHYGFPRHITSRDITFYLFCKYHEIFHKIYIINLMLDNFFLQVYGSIYYIGHVIFMLVPLVVYLFAKVPISVYTSHRRNQRYVKNIS